MTFARNWTTFQLIIIAIIKGQREDIAAFNDTDNLTWSALIHQLIVNFLLEDDGAEVSLSW